ncbi:MAG: ABC transporter permease [Actinobacteria bacterium]|nr:ABC transporter permease [Actinomycetota bacterium]MBI3256409.1 ABC transporter permease [Actinomycetota bacterium]
MTKLADYADARELTINLTLRELRGKYKRSVIGWSWSLINPLATVLIYSLVFSFFLKVTPDGGSPSGLKVFALFLLCGLLPWNYLSNGMVGGMSALVTNANLIKKVYFPREVLVVASLISWLVSMLIEMGVLVVILLLFGNMALPWIPLALLLILLQSVFVLGLGLMLSVLNVYFRDVQHFIGIILQIWFYATPIVYPINVVERAAADHHFRILGMGLDSLYHLNPMVGFVEAYRDLLYDLRLPPAGDIIYLAAWSVATMTIGMIVFNRLSGNLAEEL